MNMMNQNILTLLHNGAYPVFLYKYFSVFVIYNKVVFLNQDNYIMYKKDTPTESLNKETQVIMGEWDVDDVPDLIACCEEFKSQAGQNFDGNVKLLINAVENNNWHFIKEFGQMANNYNLIDPPEKFMNYYNKLQFR